MSFTNIQTLPGPSQSSSATSGGSYSTGPADFELPATGRDSTQRQGHDMVQELMPPTFAQSYPNHNVPLHASSNAPSAHSHAPVAQSTSIFTCGSSHGGRAVGQWNISDAELDILFRILKRYHPLTADGWSTVTTHYNEEATLAGFRSRDTATLRRKMRKLVKEAGGKKPAGKSEKSLRLQKAREVDRAIRARYSDSVFDDPTRDSVEGEYSHHEVLEVENNNKNTPTAPASKPPRKWVVEKSSNSSSPDSTLDPARSLHSATLQAITNLTATLDPDRARARDEARSEQRVMLLQLALAQQEVLHLQGEVDRLRTALLSAELLSQHAEDRLEMEKDKVAFKLELLKERAGHRNSHCPAVE